MFPDNTVLINFAIINRMDLLEKLANGNGQWCATVAGECSESAKYPGLAALSAAEDIFGGARASVVLLAEIGSRLGISRQAPQQHMRSAAVSVLRASLRTYHSSATQSICRSIASNWSRSRRVGPPQR